ncbi:hypothetical protein AYI69_g310 [Smittium culicis]|uniref:Uncharacterized protein n=1 Tax=Smittium culicis TaxID=133412 RepID=A0A1R1YTH0_9FUNG|nr:hypothetical protein AYI69_g310 [Smittium culicis]
MVERGHVPLVDALSKYCAQKPGTWPDKLHLALWADRVTAKVTTELEFKTWNSVNWKPEMSTEKLLTSRMHQLEAKDELILDVADRVKEARIKKNNTSIENTIFGQYL